MPGQKTLCELTATQVMQLYRIDRLTVEDYAHALLDRWKERNSIVQAWAYLDPQQVLNQARALDRLSRSSRGPLHGVAVGIKDLIHTKDLPTQFGSPLYKDSQPDVDASLVAILRSAEAIIFGKTTTTEFGVANSGPNTTNPHHPTRTPGGSSAGSAAAVADLQVPLSFGTQNGGSIIRPASYTVVFAMKPTVNLVSLEGVKVVSPNLDTCGFFARSLEDLQLVTSGGNGESRQNPGKTQVEEVDLPSDFRDAYNLKLTHKTVLNGGAEAAFLREYKADKTQLSSEIRGLVEDDSRITPGDLTQAIDRYAAMRPVFDDIAAGYAAIITKR